MVKKVIAATSIRWAGSFLALALSVSSAAEVPSDHAVDAAIAWISRSEPGKNPPAGSVDTSAGFTDNVDRSDPDFVKASLLIMSPGDELYSCAGHSCIRLECPTFNLDYCFSYESESVKDKIFTFFMGKLKMGMFAVPTAGYLKLGRESGRGVMQYTLNLPPDAKQRLWKILDERVAQGAYLAYDYMERGCAQAAMRVLREALAPYAMDVNPWPKKYAALSRHELLEMSITNYPW